MLPRMTRGTSSAITSSLPSPFCTLTTAASARAVRAPSTAARVCSALVATRPKSHAGRSRPSVLARTSAVKSASPVTRRPRDPIASTCSAQGSTAHTSTPGTRARCAAYRLPIAPQPMTATRTAGLCSPGPVSAGDGHVRVQRDPGDVRADGGIAAADAEPGHHLPAVADRQPAGYAEHRRHHQRRQRRGPVRLAEPGAEIAAAAVEQRRRARHRLRDGHPAGRGAVHQVLLHRVAAPVHHGHRHPDAAAGRRVHGGIAEPPGPVELGLAARRGSGGHAEAVGRVDGQVAEALLPALLVVSVLPGVRDPEGVGDQQVLGVGRPAVRAHHARVDALREERAHGRARGRDAGHDHAACARHAAGAHGHPARAGEQRLRRRLGEPGGDRRGDHRHPVQVLGARDLLRRRDPRLGPGARHPARPSRIHPGRGEQGPRRPHHGHRPAQPELLGLVHGALHQRARLGQAEVPRVRTSPRRARRPRHG